MAYQDLLSRESKGVIAFMAAYGFAYHCVMLEVRASLSKSSEERPNVRGDAIPRRPDGRKDVGTPDDRHKSALIRGRTSSAFARWSCLNHSSTISF